MGGCVGKLHNKPKNRNSSVDEIPAGTYRKRIEYENETNDNLSTSSKGSFALEETDHWQRICELLHEPFDGEILLNAYLLQINEVIESRQKTEALLSLALPIAIQQRRRIAYAPNKHLSNCRIIKIVNEAATTALDTLLNSSSMPQSKNV